MSNCLIKTKGRDPALYVHHKPDTNQYIVGGSQIGACVFTRELATRFIQEALGDPQGWEIEDLGNVVKLSSEDESAKRVLRGWPGYNT